MGGGREEGENKRRLTPHHHILDALSLRHFGPAAGPFVFFAQFGEDEGPDGFDDAGEDGVAGVEEPAGGVGRVVEVDSDFEDGVGGYAEVAADRGHLERVGRGDGMWVKWSGVEWRGVEGSGGKGLVGLARVGRCDWMGE